jgi:hypothetical protein
MIDFGLSDKRVQRITVFVIPGEAAPWFDDPFGKFLV